MRRSIPKSALVTSLGYLSPTHTTRRTFSNTPTTSSQNPNSNKSEIDVPALLSKPTWSISSLLSPKDTSSQPEQPQQISSKQLHHLLRLSALPPPVSPQEEASMLQTLSQQLHFVQEIQKVDTTGVEPLRSLRDETKLGEEEAEIGLEELREAFEGEEVRGKWHRRIRRRRSRDVAAGLKGGEGEWDPLGTAQRKVGRFFVVEGGKER